MFDAEPELCGMSIKDEILAALASSAAGLRRRELFTLCDSAGEPVEVSNALRELKSDGLIQVVQERVGNKGPVYALSSAAVEIESSQQLSDFGVVANGLVDKVSNAFEDLSEGMRPGVEKMLGAVSGDSYNGPRCDLNQPWKDWDDEAVGDGVIADVDHFDVIMKSLVAIKTQVKPQRVVDDLELKLKCLNKISVLFNPDVAEILNAIAVDLEAG